MAVKRGGWRGSRLYGQCPLILYKNLLPTAPNVELMFTEFFLCIFVQDDENPCMVGIK